MKLSNKVAQLTDIIEPAVNACDVALWGVEFLPQGGRSLLRIYIEASPELKENGKQVTIEDCTAVTHQVSGVLEVHDPIAGEYVLEVSSPGVDRPFFSTEQMASYIGETINLRLIHAIDDGTTKRRKIKGKLEQLGEKQLTIATPEGQHVDIDFNNIDKANLIYQQL